MYSKQITPRMICRNRSPCISDTGGHFCISQTTTEYFLNMQSALACQESLYDTVCNFRQKHSGAFRLGMILARFTG